MNARAVILTTDKAVLEPQAPATHRLGADLNDGVRLNIRPFVTAGALRSKFTVKWNKDRGTNPDGSERLNDLHLSRAEKEAARASHKSTGAGNGDN